jgi:hypothetical protein
MKTVLETKTKEVIDPREQIRKDVLRRLGFPRGVIRVDVKPIYGLSWRVNVWTEDGSNSLVAAGKITHSEVVTLEN